MQQPSETDFTIRSATDADVPMLGRLGALLVQTHYDFDPLRFIEATEGTEQGYGAFLKTQMGQPNVEILVAESDGNVIGYVYVGIEGYDYMTLRGPAGVIYDLVVDPSYRGHGIGGQLLRRTLERLQALGVQQVVLHTAEQNSVAQRLFARAGFRPTMIEMTRELKGSEPE